MTGRESAIRSTSDSAAVEQALMVLGASSGAGGLTLGTTALYFPAVRQNRGTGRGKTNKKGEFCQRTLARVEPLEKPTDSGKDDSAP